MSVRQAVKSVGEWAREDFKSKLRDELLAAEILHTLREANALIERWRLHYNRIRSHSSLGYWAPAPEAMASHSNCTEENI